MVWTVTYDLYRGFLIKVQKARDEGGFTYDIFKLKNRRVGGGRLVANVERALEKARQKIDDRLVDRYDVELNEEGQADLKAFLEENVRNFDPNDDSQFFRYVTEITDSKREAGATASGNIEIPGNGDYGSAKIYDAPDDYFDVVDNDEK